MGIIHGFKGNLYEKNKNVFNIIYFGGGIIFFVIIFNSILIYWPLEIYKLWILKQVQDDTIS